MIGWRNPWTKDRTLALLTEGKRLMVFDTETTGLKPQNGDRPIEFACQILNVHNGKLELELDDDFYINPGFLISDVITDLTGITNEKLQAEGVSPEDAHVAMANLFADVDVIAGYNVNFDVRMVDALYNDFGDSFPEIEALDVLEMARDIVPKSDVNNHKLGTIAAALGLDSDLAFHNAGDDVEATVRLLSYFWHEYQTQPEEEMEKIVAKINSIGYWAGHQGESRIYVNTNIGSVYFDVKSKTWMPKSGTNLSAFDMVALEYEALRQTGCADLTEFAKWKG